MGRNGDFDVDRSVDRAMDLFWRRGYTGTSLQDLLDVLSIGSLGFYEAFGSKEQFSLRALERCSALQVEDLVKILEHAAEIRPAVRQVLVAMIEADRADPSRGSGAAGEAGEAGGDGAGPSVAERAVAALCRVESALAGALDRAKSRGDLPPGKDPVELARFLTTFVQGLRVVGRARLGRSFVQDALAVAMCALD
ncbi:MULTISPECIES: TetR/AcrR family transcriptional regulator [unclassified Streptomyces]|uniref:TetR/AcrR family transcriptional regulator n=1 Tax=unclassified Streptomyces TaxID=2593676 RepID=UPI000374C77C|nr:MULTISPECIES: TetR/AcrR family transcriptional regulator [unclassified Streptomyces]MYX37930.1 TetR family transcriptional regulator [Streptomyces sp. SID8377]